MLLNRMFCDGCGRAPRFWEWVRGELTSDGYPEWRHPGIVFRDMGAPMSYDNRARCAQFFWALYGRPMPEELSYLCPECQAHAEQELPGLIAAAGGPPPTHRPWPQY